MKTQLNEKSLKRSVLKNDRLYIAWLEEQNRQVAARLTTMLNMVRQYEPELYKRFYTYGFGKDKRKK